MKKTDKHTIDLDEVASKDARCTELEDALVAKTKNGGKEWTRQFQASGEKSGKGINKP